MTDSFLAASLAQADSMTDSSADKNSASETPPDLFIRKHLAAGHSLDLDAPARASWTDIELSHRNYDLRGMRRTPPCPQIGRTLCAPRSRRLCPVPRGWSTPPWSRPSRWRVYPSRMTPSASKDVDHEYATQVLPWCPGRRGIARGNADRRTSARCGTHANHRRARHHFVPHIDAVRCSADVLPARCAVAAPVRVFRRRQGLSPGPAT